MKTQVRKLVQLIDEVVWSNHWQLDMATRERITRILEHARPARRAGIALRCMKAIGGAQTQDGLRQRYH